MKPVTRICFILFFVMTSCIEKETDDAVEAYEYWAGTDPGDEIKILHGKYWQSPHWTKEYELYLEMQTNPKWVKEFISQNKMKVKTSTELDLPYDAPSWFRPKIGLKAYEPSGFNQGSIYFVDETTGYILLYEIQL